MLDDEQVEAALAALDEPTPPRHTEQSHASSGTSARIAEHPQELRACLEDGDAFSAAALS